ncbi:Benzyl alcohol O-benzoyltransferase [Hibiscus syriacus]|uniref:Benzyl alcohol O-benzoyltransferase n=1 Tax=Hibiscus syriacus TaxID=106335 RepID=A0A6A2XTS1_HIBSY|nr:benzyl alcohol O-benzoyltransferase-like [Hibiscus syriacus]KAE8679023.1 Benzyl alcohol O-benzoyltransferase [Hibiscus syriacus]
MALLQPASLVFTVRRQEPELVVPAKPTPRECKMLSDIDDQDGHRFQIRGLHIYRCNGSMQGEDPVRVIREALAKALVFYYPFAGRLKEGPDGKLMVDCTGEGVLFVEAEADVTLDDFGDSLHPPFPCFSELLCEPPESNDLLNCPVLQIQVTRLKCGGFIFAHRFNHTMSDAVGLIQFISAMGEIARGSVASSIPPVWERQLLNARNPPVITCEHHEYDHSMVAIGTIMPTDNLVHRSFFFGPTQISALKRLISDNLCCSTFDVLTACIWRCRTIALELGPHEDVRFICIVNARSKFNPPLPLGYYGNVLGYPAAQTTARELSQNPLEFAVKLVKEVKAKVTEEYMKSTADLLVTRGRPNVNTVRSLIVSDLTRARFREVDFGWGKAEFGGPANGREIISFYIPWKNKEGKEGIAVPVCLPAPVMESFAKEINRMLTESGEVTAA